MPGDPAATQQSATVLVMTSPRLFDIDGTGVGRPDNLFYPDRGGGLRAIVGVLAEPARIEAMKARILKGLADHTGIASTPPASVTTDSSGPALLVRVTATATTGDQITITHNSGG